MTGLERELLAMRDAVVWPETPDAAAAAGARLASAPRRPRLAVRVRVAIAALVVAGAVGVAVSPAGASLLRSIGLGPTIRVTKLDRLPLPRKAGDLGEQVTLQQARLLADFPLRVLGTPERARFSAAILGGAVTLEYPDATVTEFAGSATAYLEKMIAPPTRAQRVRVNGRPGVFISGGPTRLIAADRDGQIIELGGVRAGTNVLLWDDGDVALRLQTRRDLAGALALALMLKRP